MLGKLVVRSIELCQVIVELPYGKARLPLSLADEWDVTVVAKPAMPVVADAVASVRHALTTPVGCAPLAELARGKRSACILVCDVTRPVPNGLFLRPLVKTLLHAGIDAANITLLVATGLHRPNEGDELAAVLGDPWIAEHVPVANHDAMDDAAHVDLGPTPTRATPTKLDRRFVDADLRIATGLVEPHFMAGYSGGRKVVAPGIAHAETIRTFHSARFMEHPHAAPCRLEGNPLHEEQLQMVEMLGSVFALNTVIDDARRLSFVNFGEIVASHQSAVNFAARYLTVPVPRRFRTIVTSSAGFPLDQTYYQAVKGMVTPLDIAAPNATLILAAQCAEGIGSPAFRTAQGRLRTDGAQRFLDALKAKRMADTDEWESEMLLKAQRGAHVQMLSDLDAEDRALTCVECIESLEDAVRQSVAISGENALAIVPEGPYVVPCYQPGRHGACQ